MCATPFAGPLATVLKSFGHGPWPKNPKYCGTCFGMLQQVHGGAEIECTVLFADVRGSTHLAETMSATAFRGLLSRFYAVATDVLVDRNGIVDKFVGDEVMALFIPALSGDEHAGRAVDAGRELLEATGHGREDGAWIPIGVGVASGIAYVGSVGAGDSSDLTALGDIVNVGARLASAAAAGELLVTADTARRAGLDASLERRSLELKGKSARVDVVVALEPTDTTATMS